MQRRAQVDLHHEVEALHVEVEVAGERDRGVVHEHVDRAELLDGRGDHALDLGVLGEVGRHRDRLAARVADPAHGLVDGARDRHGRGVGGARRAHDLAARARRAARAVAAPTPRLAPVTIATLPSSSMAGT